LIILQDEFYLLQALEEAKKGRGFCSPNPAVGAVAVKNNKIIAKGYHHAAGLAHAEIECMSQFPKNTPGVTLYITLEPCNHFGKTPPCVNAIVEHGIQKVVYGLHDPNQLVRALDSNEILKMHQIETCSILLPEIEAFYQSYVYWTLHNKPWVTAKWAQTLDGKNGIEGDAIHFTNQEAFDFTHQNRYHTDIILSTAQTILNDNAQFNVRLQDKVYPKPLAIIDSQLRLTGQEVCFSQARPVWIFHNHLYQPANPIKNVQYISLDSHPEHGLDLSLVLQCLAQIGFHDIWVEAGAKMMAQLHHQGLVNTSIIYVAPAVFGVNGMSAFQTPLINFENAKSIEWFPMGSNVRAKINW
jgi:diaminohydroxyphosphoribosylaminopyrimidine deaminase/5-amino-6-(5-phosphoribosylamino)uracil reductase